MKLKSGEFIVVDFVPLLYREKLKNALLEVTKRQEEPKWRHWFKFGGTGITFDCQDWEMLNIEKLSGELTNIKLKLLSCRNLPFGYIVLLHGLISEDLILKINKGEKDLGDLSKKFESVVEPVFEKLPGITTLYGREIGISELISHIILNVTFKGFKEEFKSALNDGEPDLRILSKAIRENKFLKRLGLNIGGLMSMIIPADNHVTLLGQTKSIFVNNSYNHAGYAIVEMTLKQFESLDDKFGIIYTWQTSDKFERILALQQVIFLLRYYFIKGWEFRDKLLNFLQETTKGYSFSTDTSRLYRLYNTEIQLLEYLIPIIDATKFVNTHLKVEERLQKDIFYREYGLPNFHLIDSNTGEPITIGVLEALINDVRRELPVVQELYEMLKNQYDEISHSLSNQFSIRLSETNVKLQKAIGRLTWVLVILAIIQSVLMYLTSKETIQTILSKFLLK